jgi:hypothetical protein
VAIPSPIQKQPVPLHELLPKDFETLDDNNLANDDIMTFVLRRLCEEDPDEKFPDVHIASTGLVPTMMNETQGVEYSIVRLFRDPEKERNGTLLGYRDGTASRFAKLLIFPIFTGSLTRGHWNLLIRDARGVGLKRARWRFFDTSNSSSRVTRIKKLMMSSDLWMDGMSWQTVVTPQQHEERMDCGPLTCSLGVAYVRWTRRMNHERLNTSDVQVTCREDPMTMGLAARQFTRIAAENGKLPTNHRSLQAFRFKIVKQGQVQG